MVQSGFWQITLMYVVLQFSVSYSRPSASYLCKPFTWDVSGSVGSSLASKLLPFAVSSLLLAVRAGDRRGQLVIEHFHLGPIAYAVAYLTHGTTTFVACSWHPYCAKKVASGLTVLPGMNIGRSRKPANIVSSEKCNIQHRHRIHDAVKPLRSFEVDYGAYSSQIDSITRLTSVIRNDPLMVDRRQSWFQGFCPILNRPFLRMKDATKGN
ncbi:hypothetical protein P692DRAFT_2096717 [Suillus brevipes Sb2]|nr:hypothetical protein P692DRAFT_2096717 [Suillus brevipes Sb2]